VSPALLRFSGWSLGQVRGTPLVLLIHPDDQRTAEDLLQPATEASWPPAAFPRRLRWRGAQGQWLELAVLAASPGHLVFQLQEPSPAELLEELSPPEDPLLAVPGLAWRVMEHAAIGMALVAPEDGRFLRVNAALCRLLGRSRKDLLQCRWPQLTHPEDLALDLPLLQEVLDDRRDAYRLNKRFRRPDGSLIHAQLSVACLRHPDRSVRLFISQIVDLTALHQAQEELQRQQSQRHAALQRSEQRLQLLARSSAETFFVLRQGRITWVSGAIAALGWTEEQWRDQAPDALLDASGALAGMALDRGLKPGETLEWRDRIRDAEGRWHWARFTARPYDDPDRPGEGVLVSFTLIDAQLEREQQLLHELSTDELTQLLSRRAILERLQQQMRRCRSSGTQLALIFIDLDHFKSVNDSYGHTAGDAVLRAVAQRIKASLRRGDLAGRLSGDELLVVLQGVPALNSAVQIAEALRRSTVARPVEAEGVSVPVSLSLGVTLVRPEESCEDLIARADRAMYAAKRAGRNRVEAF
jgi:diguanylate cyclase (GGDEF)-like protein/PAS domain S-box-containing protein